MKENILLIAHDYRILNEIGSKLGKATQMRTLDFNQYVEYSLSRDEKYVIDNLGIEYYWKIYKKVYGYLDDFQDALILSNIRICLNSEVVESALKDLFVVVIDIPIKEQEKYISQYLSQKGYLYNNTKTKLMNGFRQLKANADIVVKYNNNVDNTVKNIISKMLEENDK